MNWEKTIQDWDNNIPMYNKSYLSKIDKSNKILFPLESLSNKSIISKPFFMMYDDLRDFHFCFQGNLLNKNKEDINHFYFNNYFKEKDFFEKYVKMILKSRELNFKYDNLMFIHMKSSFDFWKDYCDFFINFHNSKYYNPSVLIPFNLNILETETLNFIIQYCRKNLCNLFSIDFIEMNFADNHITKNIKKILNYYIYKDSSFHMDINDQTFLQVVNDYSNYEDFIESLVKNRY